MELYLIRHGETVDNVAGLYAGVRDSALTNHGHEQANRLGQHFAKNDVRFTHIFSSPLSRAAQTADAVRSAQKAEGAADELPRALQVKTAPELIEQDFGYYEGKSFQARSDPKRSGRESHRDQHKDDPGFKDVESKESMNSRADQFLDTYLMPLFTTDSSQTLVVAIVSHGMLLSHLWRRLLLRLPPKSVSVDPEVTAARGSIVLQHLGGWGNTGYLELALTRAAKEQVRQNLDVPEPEPEPEPEPSGNSSTTTAEPVAAVASEEDVSAAVADQKASTPSTEPQILTGWTTLVRAIDRKDHLTGLKRQRGGIGSSAHDKGQKKLDGFFKRQRTS